MLIIISRLLKDLQCKAGGFPFFFFPLGDEDLLYLFLLLLQRQLPLMHLLSNSQNAAIISISLFVLLYFYFLNSTKSCLVKIQKKRVPKWLCSVPFIINWKLPLFWSTNPNDFFFNFSVLYDYVYIFILHLGGYLPVMRVPWDKDSEDSDPLSYLLLYPQYLHGKCWQTHSRGSIIISESTRYSSGFHGLSIFFPDVNPTVLTLIPLSPSSDWYCLLITDQDAIGMKQ